MVVAGLDTIMKISPYLTATWLITKQKIWKRDNGKCRICEGGGCDVHHVRYDRGFYNEKYLALLCRSCHRCFVGCDPDHLDDDHPKKKSLAEIARLARCLGKKTD